jgi:hypothetical protein
MTYAHAHMFYLSQLCLLKKLLFVSMAYIQYCQDMLERYFSSGLF